MRKQKDNEKSKNNRAPQPNNFHDLGIGFTMQGDKSTKTKFSQEDLELVTLLDDTTAINDDLFDIKDSFEQEGNIYGLYAEGVLNGQPTGADLGIYDYRPLEQILAENPDFSESHFQSYKPEKFNKDFEAGLDSEFIKTNTAFQDEYGLGQCILAESNPLNKEETKVVVTFKGYLEVCKHSFSLLRKSDSDNAKTSLVYVPEQYISRYKLRNGDEIMCTCKEDNGRMLMDSLLNINQIPYYNWNVDRPWFKDLKTSTKIKKLSNFGEYIEPIATKFGLHKGDNVCVYLNKNTQKTNTLDKLVIELSAMFDRVIYINPHCGTNPPITNSYNVVKFCTSANEEIRNQITIAALGANYARRLIELGQSVAIIIDNIDAIISLDRIHNGEMPLCKTLLSSAVATNDGAITLFTLISLRTDSVSSYILPDIFKSTETLGIVVDNNEIDLHNSYRI